MECRVESLMRNEVLLEYEVGFIFPKRPYQEELEAQILNLIDHQEDQVRQLEENMRKTKDTFMCLADSLIVTLKVIFDEKKLGSRKAHFLEDKQILNVEVLALGWHLEEIRMTWTHLEKKRTRLRLYTIYLKELCIQSVKMASQASSDGIRIFMVTASRIWQWHQNIADLKKP
ncbi:hypothetical protein Tco_0259720 [Tanacetum coccineum]